jgi:hypothetical protein
MWLVVLNGWLAIGTSASAARAQDAEQPRGELRAFAGGVWSSDWLSSGDGAGFGIGANRAVGGVGLYWLGTRFGARLHLAYVPSDLPQPSPRTEVTVPDQRLHNWLYDVGLAVRPFARPGREDWVASLYAFGGGGAFTANPEGGAATECVAAYLPGACLSYNWRNSTVGQATAGAGVTMLPLTPRLSLFTEAVIHFHSSPFHLGEHWTGHLPPPVQPEDRWVATTRLVGGLAVGFGLPRTVPAPLVPPPVTAAEPGEELPISLCVLVDGLPRYREFFVRPEVGDTVLITPQELRRPLRAVHPIPPPTASGATWFVQDEPLFLAGREYVRFGGVQEWEVEELARIGVYQGVPLYARRTAATATPPEIVFAPVQDGCAFQPFELQERARRSRR